MKDATGVALTTVITGEMRYFATSKAYDSTAKKTPMKIPNSVPINIRKTELKQIFKKSGFFTTFTSVFRVSCGDGKTSSILTFAEIICHSTIQKSSDKEVKIIFLPIFIIESTVRKFSAYCRWIERI